MAFIDVHDDLSTATDGRSQLFQCLIDSGFLEGEDVDG